MRTFLFFLIFAIPFGVPFGTFAETITYQGQLQDGGQPANGTVSMDFVLYDNEDGTGVLATAGPHSVEVTDGLFQVELNFGDVYANMPVYLQVNVEGTPLNELQAIHSAPAAHFADRVPWSGVTGAPAFWRLDGNAGTDPSTDFIGTTDFTAFVVRVDNSEVLRVEPSDDDNNVSPNLIGGHPVNTLDDSTDVDPPIVGAVIGGGGTSDHPNTVGADLATVGGGRNNIASGTQATVGGGGSNDASGWEATVAGGSVNTASGREATVGGGNRNIASVSQATVAGGEFNVATGTEATVGGGRENTASDAWATVGGGGRNTASNASATVSGGALNAADGGNATVGGGSKNTASGEHATVAGGTENTASGNQATVPGGNSNTGAGDNSFAVGAGATADHDGAFVWSDFTDTTLDAFVSTGQNQFLVQAAGGVGIGTNEPQHPLHVNGDIGIDGDAFADDVIVNASQSSVASIWFGDNVSGSSPRQMYQTTGDRFRFRNASEMSLEMDVSVSGDFDVVGTKNFVQPHPTSPDKQIDYVALEGGEAGVYWRGTAETVEGRVVVEMPDHFALVAAEEGLTAHLTLRGGWAPIYVEEVTPDRLVVAVDDHYTGDDVSFDFKVHGIRAGYENHRPVKPNTRFSPEGYESSAAFEREMARNPNAQALLIENGILNADGSLNEQTARKLKRRAETAER